MHLRLFAATVAVALATAGPAFGAEQAVVGPAPPAKPAGDGRPIGQTPPAPGLAAIPVPQLPIP